MINNEKSVPKSSMTTYLIPCSISSALGAVSSMVLLALFAFLLSMSDISEGYLTFFGYLAIALGALLCGLIASMRSKQKGLMYGLISGLLMFFVLFIFRLVLAGAESFTINSLFQLLVIVLLSGVGGIFGVNLKRKRK